LRKTEYPAVLRDLIAQLRTMPGIGPRSAERIALWIIQARGDQPEQISRAISETRRGIHPCKLCGYFATAEICEICTDSSRSTDLLCVVEQPKDLLALEAAGLYQGVYHVLLGRISPLEGINPDDLTIDGLLDH
jgi:recombination protein RecR